MPGPVDRDVRIFLFSLKVFVFSLCYLPFSHAADQVDHPITLADVYFKIRLMNEEIELIRREMGRPRESGQELPIMGATLQEVWFQAQTMYKKTDQLGFEITRNRVDSPELPKGEIIPKDVMRVIELSLSRINEIKAALNINETSVVSIIDKDKYPADLFKATVLANRQLNQLLDKNFSPSDVFQQVTLAIQYASVLLGEYEQVMERIPPTPEYERYKVPADVFRRLMQCLTLIRTTYHNYGLSSLALNPTGLDEIEIEPADVYDVASVVLAQLDFLVRRGGYEVDVKGYYPGRKVPSDVYQRVGILEAQLRILANRSGNREG